MLHHVRAAGARLRELFRRRATVATEQDEEFAFHLDMETAENLRRGMNDADARRAALLRFGGLQRFREETREARGVVALDNLARDTRFALRRLRRAPGFSGGFVATLGVGLGVAAGIGTIVYGVLLRDLPYDRPDQLVRVGFLTEGLATAGDLQSSTTYFHFATTARSFSELGAWATNDGFVVTDGDAPERVTVAMMTPSVLTLLGARPHLGQLFETGDTSWSSPRIPVLISENFWRRRYGASPAIIGRRIAINRGERVVIGVLPRSFAFPSPAVDIFYPLPIPVNRPTITLRHLAVIGRLRDGIAPADAAAELNALVPSLVDRFPAIGADMLRQSRAAVSVRPLKTAAVAEVRSQLLLLGVLVAVVLLIAATNAVNLFLLRTERARQEIAIALALGARRRALGQRFLMEGVVLGLGSALLALPVAALAVSAKFGFTEREIPRLHEVSFTAGTASLVLGSAVLLGGAVGLIALTRTSMTVLFDRLRAVRATPSAAWQRAQHGVVALQVAIALMLLIAAGLLGRSFWNLRTATIGFAPEHAMTFQVSLPWDGYRSYAEGAAFHARLRDRLASLRGVSSVATALRLPLASRGAPVLDMQLQAGDAAERPAVAAAGNLASAEYFSTMGIPLRAGRTFQAGDLHGVPAAIVSERLATALFGTTAVVGRRLVRQVADGVTTDFTIVGVAGDVHWERIEDGYAPMVYFPLQRDGDGLPADSQPLPYRPMDTHYVIRGTHLPSAAEIQAVVAERDRRVPVASAGSLGGLVERATARVRLTMLLIVVAGGAALLLGVIGVYTVVAYAATGRVREFGIRLALGAAPARVGRMVLGDGLRIVALGTGAGLAGALATTRFLRALLYEVTPLSIAEFALATALLVLIALLAISFPARRAAQTHPAVVLRGE